jgi:hypothetical protein
MSTPNIPDLIRPQSPDLMTLGMMFAKSGYFADAREQAQAIVKILAGQELGFGPVASMTGIYIVKGRVTMSANLIAASIKRSGKYDYRTIKLTNDICSLQFFERGEPVGVSEFTIEDAKTAGLIVSETYRKFARNMLFARAVSNGAKWHCADIFAGPIYTPDELGALVDHETGEMISAPADEPPAAPAAPKVATLDRIVEEWKNGKEQDKEEEPAPAREPESPQLTIVEPPSETELSLKRSICLRLRDVLRLSEPDWTKHCQEAGITSFGRATMVELSRLQRILQSLRQGKGRRA